jgi:hypothetical protein
MPTSEADFSNHLTNKTEARRVTISSEKAERNPIGMLAIERFEYDDSQRNLRSASKASVLDRN